MGLIELFFEAFCESPEYCDWSGQAILDSARKSIEGYFAGARGTPCSSSQVIEREGELAAAALVLRGRRGPVLDLLMARPRRQRQGLATGAVLAAAEELCHAGESRLLSSYDLANEASMAWHRRFGFVEEPNLLLAERMLQVSRHALARRLREGNVSPEEMTGLERERERWGSEVHNVKARASGEGWTAVCPINTI